MCKEEEKDKMMIDEEWYNQHMKELELAKQQAQSQNVTQDAQAIQIREDSTNLLKEQLGLRDELETIRHLLKGHDLQIGEHGVQVWVEPTNPDMAILTDTGVHMIMNTIMFYLNKNTLLSNYDEDIINQKMEDFATALADLIFMESEKIFKRPTDEDCQEILEERIKSKITRRKFAAKIMGKEVDEKKLEEMFWKEIEDKIEKELKNIRDQIMKNKYKRFEIIVREIQDAVHSTYLRALFGAERRTLRQHIHISENVGAPKMPTPTGSGRRGLGKWFGR